jgi:hypothetical protein
VLKLETKSYSLLRFSQKLQPNGSLEDIEMVKLKPLAACLLVALNGGWVKRICAATCFKVYKVQQQSSDLASWFW